MFSIRSVLNVDTNLRKKLALLTFVYSLFRNWNGLTFLAHPILLFVFSLLLVK